MALAPYGAWEIQEDSADQIQRTLRSLLHSSATRLEAKARRATQKKQKKNRKRTEKNRKITKKEQKKITEKEQKITEKGRVPTARREARLGLRLGLPGGAAPRGPTERGRSKRIQQTKPSPDTAGIY